MIVDMLNFKVGEHSSVQNSAEFIANNLFAKGVLICLIGGVCLLGSPFCTLASDQPQELPKPFHKTTPPLFQEWNFDTSAFGQFARRILSRSWRTDS